MGVECRAKRAVLRNRKMEAPGGRGREALSNSPAAVQKHEAHTSLEAGRLKKELWRARGPRGRVEA